MHAIFLQKVVIMMTYWNFAETIVIPLSTLIYETSQIGIMNIEYWLNVLFFSVNYE